MENTTVILVHGAFADGSSWGNVIPLLEKAGYDVIAVQNALTSFADDVATTRRVVDAQQGSVVLVGHSYGGAVITKAAVGASNVRALVYVAAFAPDEGENLQSLLTKYPSKIGTALVPDAAGFLYIDRSKFKEVFAADVSERELSVLAAAQKPINSQTFGQVYETPAWKEIPSWYLIATDDQSHQPYVAACFRQAFESYNPRGERESRPVCVKSHRSCRDHRRCWEGNCGTLGRSTGVRNDFLISNQKRNREVS